MTPQFWKHIGPQTDDFIIDLFNRGYTPEELLQPLENEDFWWQDALYSEIKFNYDSADLYIVGWLSVVDILMDDIPYAYQAFNAEWIDHMKSAIEFQWEIRQTELAEAYREELKHVS
jgi:hypothetical protein